VASNASKSLNQGGENPLQQSAQFLRGVGPTRYELLQRLHIETIADLLFHFPRSYEDLTDIRPIAQLDSGRVQTVQGEIVEMEGRETQRGQTLVSIVVSDGGKTVLEGVWFNQPYITSRYRYGQRVAFSGKPSWYRGHWQMNNPRVQPLDKETAADLPKVLPIYPLTEDLRLEQLRPIIRRAVEEYGMYVAEILPPALRQERLLPDAQKALRDVHMPETIGDARTARRRFVYEEFLILQLALGVRRRELRDRQQAPVFKVTAAIDAHIRRLFPFRLTRDQDKAVTEICKDLASDRPMQRLLQADVGAGKTAVAVYALLATVADKHQAILMAPTEVLARQHWHTLERYLAKSRVRRLLLTGGLSQRERRAALTAIRGGDVDLVVGTQALVQEDVQFAKLGLVVIDEQHRFGVNQRARVRRLGVDPHYLVMTATPIPRTVALTVFGDLDVSVIRQMPPGRKPVSTRWVTENQREKLYGHLREGLRQKQQAFVVCPLVAESERSDLKAAAETFEELQSGPFAEFRVGLLHGRLDDAEKDKVMAQFRAGEVDLLVATSVIEVGIDVPNATLLVIEHAERFGLSQLHQLRGRIARGSRPGECFFFAEPATDEARDRLKALCKTSDGFEVAEMDARLRGVGEFFGTRQHGLGEFRFADLLADLEVLTWARQDAFALVTADAGLRRPEHEALRLAVLDRYGKTLDLAEIG
jgi:ATP-dependent DNA helicase RecG